MRVLVAGAGGAIGQSLIPRLVAAGHVVVGLTRTAEKVKLLAQAAHEAVAADALDPVAIRRVVIAAKPDVIVHEMTSLSEATDLRKFDRAFALTNRLRTEGLDHLLAAAREIGTRRIVAQSFCGWPYARTGKPVKSEGDDLDSEPPREFQRSLEAIRYLESTLTGLADIEGLALRYGAFYGPQTGILDKPIVEEIRRRRFPLIGDGNGWWSFVHIEDAAAATVAAVGRGRPGIYNIVDDEPAPVREWLPALATLLGAKPPRRVPKCLARLFAGEHLVTMMTEARAGSNAKAKIELGWRPMRASWREGFASALPKYE